MKILLRCSLVFLALACISFSPSDAEDCTELITVRESYICWAYTGWWWWRTRHSSICYRTATRTRIRSNCGSGSCDDVQLVTRGEWGARPPVKTAPLQTPVSMTFIHHTAGATCSTLERCSYVMRNTQADHIDRNKWNDIGYSFLIGGDGRVYEGRGWTHYPAHETWYNRKAHGISFMGNFMNVAPTEAAQKAAKAWIQCGVDRGYIKPDYELFGHRDGHKTLCPGDVLYRIIQTWPHYSHRSIPVRP